MNKKINETSNKIIIIKIVIIVFVCALFMTFLVNKSNQKKRDEAELQKVFRLESGIIDYEVKGTHQGIQRMSFDEFGNRQRLYEEVIYNMGKDYSKEVRRITLLDNYQGFKIDLLNNTSHTFISEELNQSSLILKNEEVFKEMGGIVVGSGKILGRKCDIWRVDDLSMKIWLWNSIALKRQIISSQGDVEYIAVNIKENVSIPEAEISIAEVIKKYTVNRSE